MEPHVRNYQINHKFEEKDSGYYCWKLRKKKVKHYILFRNCSSRLARALRTIRAAWARKEWKNVYEETSQTYPEILVPQLNNSSEETIFGSNEIKE